MRAKTAKAFGFKKGDFIWTGYFPGILIGDVNTFTPQCEVWGVEHEIGSCYAHQMKKIIPAQFVLFAKEYGFNGSAYTKVARDVLKVMIFKNVEFRLALAGV